MNTELTINESRKVKMNNENSNRADMINKILLLVLFSVIFILIMIPFYAVALSSFRSGDALIRYGMNLNFNAEELTLNSFRYLFKGDHDYFIWFKNSMILTVVQVALTLFISAFVSYGFAAYEFKGKNLLFTCVLLIMMVPFEILLLPLYTQINDLGLMNTFSGIVLPGVANASTIFFFRQYLRSVPREIIASGRVDGASEYGIFFRLIIPVMKPSFAAMAILNGMNSWNNLLWPFMVLADQSKFTLPIGLKTLLTPYGNNYDLLFVGSFFSIIPIFILFLCFQKYFIEGLTAGAVKG